MRNFEKNQISNCIFYRAKRVLLLRAASLSLAKVSIAINDFTITLHS